MNASGAFADAAAWLTSGILRSTSVGALALVGHSAQTLNFTGYNTLQLGATTNATYSGTITPGTAGFQLGGGTATLTVSSALTGANAVTVGNTNGAYTLGGGVVLNGANTYTGLTTVNAGFLAFGAGALTPSVAAAVTTGASGTNTVTVSAADAAKLAVGMRFT